MGRTVFSGRLETGHPHGKIEEECFMQQVRNGFSWYSGDLGAVRYIENKPILKDGKIEWRFERFLKEHPELKNKNDQIEGYLVEEAWRLDEDKDTLIYAVDKSRISGYEILTFGGHQEVPVRQLPEMYFSNLNPKANGYKLFKLTLQTNNRSECRPIEDKNFSSIHDIETFLLDNSYWRSRLLSGQVYFAIKNDGSKAYMIGPKSQFVKSTTRQSNEKQLVRKVHPVFYAAKVLC